MIGAYWPALEAERQLAAVTASAAPHAKPSDYRRLVATLEAEAGALTPAYVAPRIETQEHDPARAAEWFAAQGVKVASSG